MPTNQSFLVNKTKLAKTNFVEQPQPEISQGEVLFKIDKYAFTSNNITYAVIGKQLKYWDFFPAPEPWGSIPVWGFADVVASEVEGVGVGQRFYGYFPMSTYLKVQVGKLNPYGFADITAHRQHLSPIYNHYSLTSADPTYSVDTEDYLPIFKPLFATSFLTYHFLKDEAFFEAENVILTSASSKTALSLAFLLKKYQAQDGKKIIGLTSTKNVDFVKESGYYDEVIAYDEAVKKCSKTNTVIIDFSGNSALLESLYESLGDFLKHIALIGLTDWKAQKQEKTIPVAHFFFAPTHIQNRYKEWGAVETTLRLAKEMSDFIQVAQHWMELTYATNPAALSALYGNMFRGQVDPRKGWIVQVFSEF